MIVRTALAVVIAAATATTSAEGRLRASDDSQVQDQHRVLAKPEKGPKVYPEVFEFQGKIELVNGDLQCIESNLEGISKAILDGLDETDKQMEMILLQDHTVLASGAEFSTDVTPSTVDESQGRRLGFVYTTNGYTKARMSYDDNSDGFIPALTIPEDSVLNYNINELLEEQSKSMKETLDEAAELTDTLEKSKSKFNEKLTRVTDKIAEKLSVIQEKKEAQEERAAAFKARVSAGEKNEKWLARKMKSVDKQLAKLAANEQKFNEKKVEVETLVEEFEGEQTGERRKMEEKIALVWSFHQMELSAVMVAREPAWNDFKKALKAFTIQAKLNIQRLLFEQFDECFEESPEVELTMTPVPVKLPVYEDLDMGFLGPPLKQP